MTELTPNATIYAVASGQYSDYSVLCVCPSEAEAEALVAKLKAEGTRHSDAYVEELHVLDSTAEPIVTLTLGVNIYDDETTEAYERYTSWWPFEHHGTATCKWSWQRFHNPDGGQLVVTGSDHERVRRVFSERRARFIADPASRVQDRLGGTR